MKALTLKGIRKAIKLGKEFREKYGDWEVIDTKYKLIELEKERRERFDLSKWCQVDYGEFPVTPGQIIQSLIWAKRQNQPLVIRNFDIDYNAWPNQRRPRRKNV